MSEEKLCVVWSKIFGTPTVCMREKCSEWYDLEYVGENQEKKVGKCNRYSALVLLDDIATILYRFLEGSNGDIAEEPEYEPTNDKVDGYL